MSDCNDDDVDGILATKVANAFTGLARTCFPGLLRDGELEEALDLDPPVDPEVRISSTIRINLERGQTGECYVWSKEEATLIRDALIAELGNPTPAWTPQSPIYPYPNTSPGIGTPWVTYGGIPTG